jgi:sodium-dependent dicarboxylate transporter 2/3/5
MTEITISRAAFWGGLLIAAATVIMPATPGLSSAAWAVAGIGLMMGLWWVSEAIPLPATALVPLALFPLLGIASIERLASAYAHPLIFLFLGGFMIARAMERSRLHRRLALAILSRAGNKPAAVVAAMMTATAFLSLWISNTAAAMVMAPIAASVAATSRDGDGFAPALMLGVAYAATIGGMGSIIGTPPNALFAAYMSDVHGVEIGFAEWMAVGLPIVAILLPLTWAVLTRVTFRLGLEPFAMGLEPCGPVSSSERRVGLVAAATAIAWIVRPALDRLVPGFPITDAGIAMTAAIALFAIPAGGDDQRRLLDWETAAGLRWDVLILFGGGLALAAAISDTGLGAWIGAQAKALQDLPELALLMAFALIIVYLGELASNTAMAAIFLPVAGAMAIGIGADPLTFTLPVALAASIGFMLPVATPPNAIVFGNPAVTHGRMLRAGAPLDLIGAAVAVAVGSILGPAIFLP